MANDRQGRAAAAASKRWRRLGLCALLGVLASGIGQAPRSAEAAVTLEAVSAGAVPAIERALVIHNVSTGLEHLIQDFTFAANETPRALLLPVPARPTVSKLTSSPFAKLATNSLAAAGSGFGSSGPERLSGAPDPAEKAGADVRAAAEQVGRLTTSVLAAGDSSAVKKWLASNKLVADAAIDAWLAPYAARGFYFVAVRIEPKLKQDAATTLTETLQISFASPQPYFPYAEALENLGLRQLSVWLLSSRRQVPVALASVEGQAQWLRPWHEVDSTQPTLQDLKSMLPKSLIALLPPALEQKKAMIRYAEHTLQHFEDQKSSRVGYGDIVLVPEEPRAQESTPELRRLMGVLDPEVKP